MDNHNSSHIDPWDRDSYETGSTRPPKSRSGLIAVLLVLVILLVGVFSAMGILNIRLQDQAVGPAEPDNPVVFHPSQEPIPSVDTSVPGLTTPTPPEAPQLQLNKTPLSVENVPQDGGFSLQQIYQKAIDSVVSISCTLSGGTASGTGVVLSENGYIVTNCHVVEGARAIRVLFTDGRIMDAALIGSDPVSDLAVLYVAAGDLTPAEFGNSNSLRVGDAVAAIGDPLGIELRGTMTDGIVSAINREVAVGQRRMTLIQTNAAMNSGNSGGPLLNCYGQVIGINTMKISAFADDAGVEGLGFAIPSTTVKDIVDQLIGKGYVTGRPSLGLTGEDVPESYQFYYQLPEGVYITSVTEGGAAHKAGLAVGDIILSANGARIRSADDLSQVLYSHEAGDPVSLVVYRSRKQYSVTVTLDQAGG